MARKLVLCASAHHLTAAFWNGRRLASIRRFDDEKEEDLQAFGAMLMRAHGIPVYLMADTVDEDYRFETLPHARGKDRREMLERKLKQLYRSTPFYGAVAQEREAGKRRDDRFLFAALTNPEGFNNWVKVLVASGVPVAGVFPLPMVSLALLKKLDLKDPNLLLVSRNEAGIRQTFIKNERFRISRLTPVREEQHSGTLEASAEEIRNTRMYLDALNITHVDDVLTVVVLDQDGTLSSLADAITSGRRNIRASSVSPDELVAKVGVDRDALRTNGDALHLHLLGQTKTALFNLAPPVLTSGFTRLQTSKAIYASAVGVAALALLWCGFSIYQVFDLRAKAQETAAVTQQETVKYQQITRSFPPAPVTAEKLQASVEIADRIEGMSRLPDTMFRIVSENLERYPAMRLTGVTWKTGHTTATGGTPSNAAPPASTRLTQSAVLEMELTTLPGDYRSALSSINSFAKELSKQQNVSDASVLKLPLNLASTSSLQGSTQTPRQERAQQAQFQIQIVLKPGV